jgi:hypothetical protein
MQITRDKNIGHTMKIEKFLYLITLLFFILFQSCENLSTTSIENEKQTPYIKSENISPLQFNTTTLQTNNNVVRLDIDVSLIEILNGDDAKRIEQFKYEISNLTAFELNFSGNIENITSSPIFNNSIQHNGRIFIGIKESDIGNYLLQVYGTNSETHNSNSILANFLVIRQNDPPFIEYVIAPDTIIVDIPTVSFVVSAKVFDLQGRADINRVYFNSYRPDGVPASGNPFTMFDNGDRNGPSGDLVANDGIYSLRINITQENLKGTYRFDFYAVDKSGSRSGIYQHFIVVM